MELMLLLQLLVKCLFWLFLFYSYEDPRVVEMALGPHGFTFTSQQVGMGCDRESGPRSLSAFGG